MAAVGCHIGQHKCFSRHGHRPGRQTGIGRIGKNWNVAVGVNDFTDRWPPLSPQAFSDNLADVASYSPIGRLVYISAALKF